MKKVCAFGRRPSRREVLKYGLFGAATASLAPYLWVGGCGKSAGVKKPNIILITVDTLRADHLGCYGYGKNTSPFIDKFSQESMVYENCFSQAPVTSSSFASILSGYLPHETMVYENLPLPGEVETIEKTLQRQGYQTGAVVSNFNLRREVGWAEGFDHFDDDLKSRERNRNYNESIAHQTTERSINILSKLTSEQMFMWVHYQDPHGPYTPPADYAEQFKVDNERHRSLRINSGVSGYGGIPSYQKLGISTDYHHYVSQYDGEISYMDQEFERLIQAIKKMGLYDNSLIIFTADHGEGMGENDYYFAHGENLHRSLLHVPLMVRYGSDLIGRRSNNVQHIDIVPTIHKFIDLETEMQFRGQDLLVEQKESREIFAEMSSPMNNDGPKFCLMKDECKLIYTPVSNKYQMFDVSVDPEERRNLIDNAEYRHRTQDLQARLDDIRHENLIGQEIANEMPALSPADREILRALGYVR
ncbi:MAG: sulfatase [Planctomycetes bacterium]|nr:sulfatase [Planctomycetota bacterium]